jgi:serine/threonine protein phosphatase PrpC
VNDPAFRIQSGAVSDEGCVRTRNEDSYLDDDQSGVWAVADGMGGHAKGDWASATIVEQLAGPLASVGFDSACRELAERIHRANGLIFAEAEQRETQMGSTVVALHVQGRRFAILWVGDSRAYVLRDGILHLLSRDHTQIQEMLDRGLLSPAEAENHPMGHVLARAVGVTPQVEVDVIQDEVEPGDTFLLCSDGLHGCVPHERIAELAALHPVEAVARGLVDLTVEHGAPDNVTVVAIRFSEATLLALPQETAP